MTARPSRRPAAARIDATRYPALADFLAGYLHQDFAVEHRTALVAADAFKRDATPQERRQLRDQARRFATATADWPLARVREALATLGSAWHPRDGAAVRRLLNRLGQ